MVIRRVLTTAAANISKVMLNWAPRRLLVVIVPEAAAGGRSDLVRRCAGDEAKRFVVAPAAGMT